MGPAFIKIVAPVSNSFLAKTVNTHCCILVLEKEASDELKIILCLFSFYNPVMRPY